MTLSQLDIMIDSNIWKKNIFNQHCLLMALHLILAPLGAKLSASTSLKDNQGAAKNINQTWSCIKIYPYWI